MSESRHRHDIDVLRAIAVLSVIVFHLDPELLPGGYVGVDVFFVISGFLITGGILERSGAGTFRFGEFYLRRFRRLFPAALVTVAGTFAAGIAWLSPEHLRGLAASSLSAVFSVSNFYFWRHQGYFDTDAEFSPLLHTWSLGVEEQFYLVWPLLIVLAGVVRSRLQSVLWIVLLLSTIAAEVALQIDASTAYYLMPFRAGEFALGALCCRMLTLGPVAAFGDRAAVALYLIGLGLVAGSAFLLNGGSRFPGGVALIPCVGAAAMILAGSKGALPALAGNPVFGWIGRSSYSLYLVHWPIVEFWRYHGLAIDSWQSFATVACLILGAGAMLHYAVEVTFRAPATGRPPRVSARAALTASALAALLLCVGAADAYRSEGWPGRVPTAIAAAIENSHDARKRAVEATKSTCSLDQSARPIEWWADCVRERLGGRPGYLIIGDSHGRDTLETLRLAYPDENFAMVYQSSCLPFEYKRGGGRSRCFVGMQEFLHEQLSSLPLRGVLLSSDFSPSRDESTAATVEAIRAQGLPAIVFGPTMIFSQPMPNVALKHGRVAGLEKRVNELQDPNLYDRDLALAAVVGRENAAYVSKLETICPDRDCIVVHPGEGALLCFDTAHWTPATHAYVATRWRTRWPELGDLFESSAGGAASATSR